jgi:hypothetical protein
MKHWFARTAVIAALLVAAPAAAAPRGPAAIPTPPRAVLDRALRGLDPMLADEVRPDGHYENSECVVLLMLYRRGAPSGQRRAIDAASRRWRASVVRELGRQGADQMIGSSVNPLIPTPRPLQQAAAAWCVGHMPRG